MRGFGSIRWLVAVAAALAVATALVGPAVGSAIAQQPTPISPQPTPIPPAPIQPTPIPVAPTPRPPAPGQPAPVPQPGQPPAQPGAPPVQTGPVNARITYPPNRQIIIIQPFLVIFEIAGIRLDASQIDQPSAPGVGHWLLLVDGVEVAAGDSLQVALSGVSPGTHELVLQVRNNDRSPLVPPVSAQSEICIEVCSPSPVQPFLPEVPGGLPRTGTGGLARPR